MCNAYSGNVSALARWMLHGKIHTFIAKNIFGAAENCALRIAYIPGQANILADALSRYDNASFRRLRPHADAAPTLINSELSEL